MVGLLGRGIAISVVLLACSCDEASLPEAPLNPALRTKAPKFEAAVERPVLSRVAEHSGANEPKTDPGRCPEGMALVTGSFCPNVKHQCLRYMNAHGRYAKYRCAEYAEPRCLSQQRQSMHFCIDQNEYQEHEARLPLNHQTYLDGQRLCEAQDRYLCTENEWIFACEGEEMRPYPYGSKRRPDACNADRLEILTPGRALKDLRAPWDTFPDCVSPFGVRNLTGNLEEFVVGSHLGSTRPVMKGAYWQPGRNTCRARQTVHGAHYSGTETGFRCCAKPDTR
jgi:hypothetical protein